MEWCKLFANLPDHPRVQAAEDNGGAGWLLAQSFCYCTRAESDGFIPYTQVPRFGGERLKQRVAALVREGLWIADDDLGGYLLDPEIWNEDRNLSDQAEKKRKADRLRMAAKRAAERASGASQNGHMSRDSRATRSATPSATSRRDSRTVEKRRGEQPPPASPLPLWPAAVPDARPEEEGDQSGRQTSQWDALVAAIRAERPGWSTRSIERALADPSVAERPWDLVWSAALEVARDPASEHPGRLAHDGPWWTRPAAPHTAPRPPWCGDCDEQTRLTSEDHPRRCPVCHPLREAS